MPWPLAAFRKGFSEQSVLPVTDSVESFQGPSVQSTPRIPLYEDSISLGILDTLSNPSESVTHADPSKSRIMLVDGTSVMYRSYYKILAQLQHGQLEHADSNGDWVLTIFKALSLLLDMLEFIPSHAAVVFDHDGSLENLLKSLEEVEDERIKKALISHSEQAILCKNLATLRSDLPPYMVPFKTSDLVFQKPEDDGVKLIKLLRALEAYAEGSSADPIIRKASYLWNKLKSS